MGPTSLYSGEIPCSGFSSREETLGPKDRRFFPPPTHSQTLVGESCPLRKVSSPWLATRESEKTLLPHLSYPSVFVFYTLYSSLSGEGCVPSKGEW